MKIFNNLQLSNFVVIFSLIIGNSLITKANSQDTSLQSQQVEINQLKFQLKNCMRNGNNVDCNFLITNHGKDRDLKLYSSEASGGRSPSRAIATSGEEFATTIYQLGNQSTTSSWKVRNTLVSGIPLQAKFTFNNVDPQITELALIQIGFGIVDTDTISTNFFGATAQFRNITIQSP